MHGLEESMMFASYIAAQTASTSEPRLPANALEVSRSKYTMSNS